MHAISVNLFLYDCIKMADGGCKRVNELLIDKAKENTFLFPVSLPSLLFFMATKMDRHCLTKEYFHIIIFIKY